MPILSVRFFCMTGNAKSLEIGVFPRHLDQLGRPLADRPDVVHLQALTAAAADAGESVSGQDPSLAARPVGWPGLISNGGSIPAPSELMIITAAV